jgi:hypothetical protein
MKRKNKYIFTLIIVITVTLFFYFFFKEKNLLNSISGLVNYSKFFIDTRYFLNNYNNVFLPKTQFIDLDIRKLKILIPKNYNNEGLNPKFIEILKSNILIIDSMGNFFQNSNNDNLLNNKKLDFKPVNSNLKNINLIKLLGTLTNDNEIYISYVKKINDQCKILSIAKSNLSLNNLNFIDILNISECAKGPVYGGKLKFYIHQNKPGILITTSDTIMQDDFNDNRAQDSKSLFNKIIFYEFNNKKMFIFSKGHRNPAGLYVEKNLILSTEHGPRGGDEINKILFKKNYGWPIASYGEPYQTKNLKPLYKKSHVKFNFEEPIFTFVPSIAISEIIKIPHTFSEQWEGNFLIGSLNGKSIYRLKFNQNYNKVLFVEKIYIGKRIRDLKYNHNLESIMVTFDEDWEMLLINSKKKLN